MNIFFRMTAADISSKSPLTEKYTAFLSTWECTEYTVLRCMQALAGNLLQNEMIDVPTLELIGNFILFINFRD